MRTNVLREPRGVFCPGYRRRVDAATRALDSGQLVLEEDLRGAKVERSPSARLRRHVVDRGLLAAYMAAAEPGLALPDRHDEQAVAVDPGRFHDREVHVYRLFE